MQIASQFLQLNTAIMFFQHSSFSNLLCRQWKLSILRIWSENLKFEDHQSLETIVKPDIYFFMELISKCINRTTSFSIDWDESNLYQAIKWRSFIWDLTKSPNRKDVKRQQVAHVSYWKRNPFNLGISKNECGKRWSLRISCSIAMCLGQRYFKVLLVSPYSMFWNNTSK